MSDADLTPRMPAASRFAIVFGGGMVLGHAGQLSWLFAGSRALSREAFGSVLAAQALYSVLQLVVDNGAAYHGARLVAARALEPALRSSIIRLRLQLALIASFVGLVIGAAGGARMLEAVAPFAFALVLFALLSYWERFGQGDARPWSAYLVLRAGGTALAAGICLLASTRFPLFLAGIVECGAILVVMLAFRLRPDRDLPQALAAGRGPWRTVVNVGLPSLVWQAGFASGTVLLSTSGAAAAAAVLAVSVRLLTGLNQLSAILATSFFPQLAGRPEDTRQGESDDRAIAIATRAPIALLAAAYACVLLVPATVLHVFLGSSSVSAEQTLIVTFSSALATSYVIALSVVLIARRRELLFLRVSAIGTALTLAGGLAVVLATSRREELWMAGVFLAAQMVAVCFLLAGGGRVFPGSRGTLRASALAAWAAGATGPLCAAVPPARAPVAALLLLAACMLAVSAVSGARRTDAAGRPAIP